jgi:hypothetical protein
MKTADEKQLEAALEQARQRVKHLVTRDHEQYLPIGVVATDPDPAKKAVLIELPHEADSGVNRLWVPADNLLRDAAK